MAKGRYGAERPEIIRAARKLNSLAELYRGNMANKLAQITHTQR